MFKSFKILLCLFLFWFCCHTCFTVFDGLKNDIVKSDLAIVMGNKVNEDGSLSLRLEKRLEAALYLYNNKFVDKILVSGGKGKEGFFEGSKMKEFLLNSKIPSSVVIVDNKGVNTRATVSNFLNLKDSLNVKSVIVVSQYFHLTRSKMLFRKNNFQNIQSYSPFYFEFRDFYALFREFFAYYSQIL